MSDSAEAAPVKASLLVRFKSMLKKTAPSDGEAPSESGFAAYKLPIMLVVSLLLLLFAFFGGIALGRAKSKMEATVVQNQLKASQATLKKMREAKQQLEEEASHLKTEKDQKTAEAAKLAVELKATEQVLSETRSKLAEVELAIQTAGHGQPPVVAAAKPEPPKPLFSRNKSCVLSGDIGSMREGLSNCVSRSAAAKAPAPPAAVPAPAKPPHGNGH